MPLGMAPCDTKRSLTAGEASDLATSCCTRFTTSGGVPAGASRPNQDDASKPLNGAPPASAMVGNSGSTDERTALVTASAFSLPALMCGSELGRLSNIRSTLPPSRSISAGPEPRYGRWVMKVPVIALNSSADRWIDVPLPELATLSLPGLALAARTRSLTEPIWYFAADPGLSTSTFGTPAHSVMGAKSFTWSYGILG